LPEDDGDLTKTLNQLRGAAIRRRWWILLPACVVAFGGVVVSTFLPKKYKSEATILVEPQKVPERYIVSNTTLDIEDELQAMTETVLSRTRLLQAIEDFGLYSKERSHEPPEQLIELMRGNIEIEPIGKDSQRRQVSAFRISFTGDDPSVAQQVTSRLTSMFIEENLKTREQQSAGTTHFLQDQLVTAHAELEERGQKLRDFKMQYLGELPEEQQGNLGILTGLQSQLQNTMAALNRAQEQRSYLESLLAEYRRMAAVGGPLPSATGINPGVSPVEAAQQELAHLRGERAKLVSQYTERHPDVRKIDQQIADTEALVGRLTKAAKATEEAHGAGTTPSTGTTPSSGAPGDSSLAQLNSQLESNRKEIANLTEEQKRQESQIADYQRRLNLTPVREQQLTDLLANYELAKQNYSDMLKKKTESEMATKLEVQQQGQQFRVVDQPNLPSKPSNTDRSKVSLGGAAAGLALGLALAFLLETADHSLYDEHDVSRRFGIPLVVSVPRLPSAAEERKRPWRMGLEWAAGSVLVVAVALAEFYVYRRG
jgi:polysaccharide chain length determinant protein (PEP-CTERM system associated)